MAGLFPASTDGGLPPNPGDPANPIRAYPPAVPPLDTTALYYGNGCDVRLRPEVLNSILSEIEAVVDEAGLGYQSTNQQNLEVAIRYLIQRGLPHSGFMAGGPLDYALALDPAPATYTNYLLLTVVPEEGNTGPVRVNVNGLGLVPVLRNDGTPLHRYDLPAAIPALLAYWQGNFYLPYLVRSQVPLIGVGAVDGWIRTDGDDTTGDGTANTPDKAFRTIEGAVAALAGRYVQTPGFSLNLRLGIPGVYAAALIANIDNTVRITGDRGNRAAYQISGRTGYTGIGHNLYLVGCPSVTLEGVTLIMDQPGVPHYATHVSQSTLYCRDVRVEKGVNNPLQVPFLVEFGNLYFQDAIEVTVGGNLRCLIEASSGSNVADAGATPHFTMSLQNISFTQACVYAHELSVVRWGPNEPLQGGVGGPKYLVTTNAILNGGGKTIPGNVAGSVSTGGQYVP